MHYLYTFQWHITNRCNWRCKHCYHDSYDGSGELSFEELKRVFHEFLELSRSTLRDHGRKPRIVITGGEPFVHQDFMKLLQHMSDYKDQVDATILTNGSLLTESLLDEIQKTAPVVDSFQISIEGHEEINDKIRGKGAFEKILNAITLLNEKGFNNHLSITLSQLNKDDIFELVDLLLAYNTSLVIRRFVPIGQGEKNMKELLLSPEEMKIFYAKVQETNEKFSIKPHATVLHSPYANHPLKVENCVHGIDEAGGSSPVKRCAVPHKALIVVMPNGDVLPCRLLPKILGNIREQSLAEIYHSENYNQYTQLAKRDDTCKQCSHFAKCQGGAMCISDAVTHNPFAKDPQCWR